jgi:hypothetical protein
VDKHSLLISVHFLAPIRFFIFLIDPFFWLVFGHCFGGKTGQCDKPNDKHLIASWPCNAPDMERSMVNEGWFMVWFRTLITRENYIKMIDKFWIIHWHGPSHIMTLDYW